MSDSVQPETDDFALMAQVRAGREDAFRQLMERHRRPVLNFFARMGASTAGEDLAQETFIRLWNYRSKYKPTAKFTTFLYTLARHVWLDFVRRQVRFRLFSDRYRAEMPASSDGGMGRMRKQLDIQAALEGLSPKLREVLVRVSLQHLERILEDGFFAAVLRCFEEPVGEFDQLLVLAVHQGCSYDEIAAILSIPVGTVKSRVFNALSTLQEMYNEIHL